MLRPSAEPSHQPSLRDGSDEGSGHSASMRNRKNLIKYSLLTRALDISIFDSIPFLRMYVPDFQSSYDLKQ